MDDQRAAAKLEDLATRSRGALGSLTAAVESLQNFPEAPADVQRRWLAAIADENQRLLEIVRGLEDLRAEIGGSEPPTNVATLLTHLGEAAATAGLDVRPTPSATPSAEAAAPRALAPAFAAFCSALRRHHALGEAQLQSTQNGDLLIVDLIWQLEPPTSDLEAWLARSVESTHTEGVPSLRDLTRSVGGEAWTLVDRDETRGRLRLLLPLQGAPDAAA